MYYSEDKINYDEIYIKALDGMPIGSVIGFVGTDIPNGWLVCDGSTITQSDYPELYDLIGGTLPDYQGRVPVGYDANDTDFDTLLETGGSKTDDLSNAFANIGISSDGHVYNKEVTGFYDSSKSISGGYGTTGGASKHNATGLSGTTSTLQPYIVHYWIIKAKNTTPTMASVVNATNDSTEDTYSCDYINDNYFSHKILWENPNPTSDFASQNITLNSGDYNYYEIIYKDSPAGTHALSTGKIPKGFGARMQLSGGWGGTHLTTDRREAAYTDATTIYIPTCITYDQSNGSTSYGTSNSAIIPIQVIGYK